MPTSYPMSFALTELTSTLEDIPFKPQLLGGLGLFQYKGIPTITAQIERQGNTLALVSTKPRGTAGSAIGRATKGLRPFNVVHVPLDDMVLADEVQGERLFGSETEPTPFQTRLMEVMELGRQRLEYTLEWHRIGALKGQVLDADGSTVLLDMFTEFGVSQNTDTLALTTSTTKVRARCDDFRDKIFDELGGVTFTGVEALVGSTAWKNLIEHPLVRDTYLNTAEARDLRSGMPDTFVYGDIIFRRYRGKANGSDIIGANEMWVYPVGVPGLFIGRFGPADYIETVNKPGLVMYAQGVPLPNGKGYTIEMQSNPLHICTRPRAVIKVTCS